MVASYLVHHSYCATAEAFAKSTDQAVQEELASIKNRQSELLPVLEQVPGGGFLSFANFHDVPPSQSESKSKMTAVATSAAKTAAQPRDESLPRTKF